MVDRDSAGPPTHHPPLLPVACFLAVLSVAVPGRASGQTDWAPAENAARVDSLLAARFAPDEPGMAVLALKDGAPAYEGAIGVRNLDSGASIDLDTPFYVASVGKAVTATAVLQLVADGRAALDAPIGDYLPGLPRFAHTPTVRELLSHTGGVPDYYEVLGADVRGITNDRALQTLEAAGELDFEPGTDWAYSNTGYVILAELIEQVSGATYAAYVTDRVLAPAAMARTFVIDGPGVEVPGRAVGYRPDRTGGFVRDDYGSFTTGPGGLYSTARDLARFMTALPGLLPPDLLDQAFTAVREPNGDRTPFGLGWLVEKFSTGPWPGEEYVMQIGVLNGFLSRVLYMPRRRLTVIMLANVPGELGWTWEVPSVLYGGPAGAP